MLRPNKRSHFWISLLAKAPHLQLLPLDSRLPMFVHFIHLAKSTGSIQCYLQKQSFFCSFVCNFLMMKASYCETGLIMIKCHLNFFLSHPSNSLILLKLCHINFGTKEFSTSLVLLPFSRQTWTEVKANQIIVCCTAEFVHQMYLKRQEGFML